jgi:ABC-2 type transport system ATP-binding protein
MAEAEHCNRIAIIDQGKVVALDTPRNLKAMVGGDLVTIRTSDNVHAANVLSTLHGLEIQGSDDDTLIIETAHGERFIPIMVDVFRAANPPIQVDTIGLRHPTLEDVFVKLTGHGIRAAEADTVQPLREMARMWLGKKR